MLPAYVEQVGVNAVGLDYSTPVGVADTILRRGLPVQGNLDPLRLVAGGAQMDERARSIVEGFRNRPHIFNLGHGIVPETPIGHVSRLIDVVRES